VTNRIVAYCGILLLLGASLGALLLTRSDVDATLFRAPGSLFQTTPEGRISNLYLLKLTNKTHRQIPVDLRLLGIEGNLKVLGGELRLPAEQQTQASVLVEIPPDKLRSGSTPIVVVVFSGERELDRIKTGFIGTRVSPAGK